jgi:hypothetical protein
VYHSPIGQLRTPVMSCPHCSYLVEGSCVVCPDGDPHPACEGCKNGRLPPQPWYKNDLAIAIMTSTVVAISSAIIMGQVRARTKLLK